MGSGIFDIDQRLAQLMKPVSFAVAHSPHHPDFWSSDEPWIALAPGEQAEDLEVFVRSAVPQGACVFQTSGSEGRPKWVVLTKRALLHSARAVCEHLQVTNADRWLLALPEWHVGGFSLWARAQVSGSAVVKGEAKWSAAGFVAACARHRISLVSLVPTQVFDLVHTRLSCPPSVRAVVVGGGRLERELGSRARSLGWPVLQSYGMTETGSQVATEPLEHLMTGFDPDQLQVLPCWQADLDAHGRLKLSGAALAEGYITCESDGWRFSPLHGELLTRDIVELSPSAGRTWLKMIVRESQMLKVLGELVHLGPLQSRLSALASERGIRHAQLAGAADERAGEVVILRCEAGREAEAEALRLAFNEQVRPFERAVRVEAAQISDLGKMRR